MLDCNSADTGHGTLPWLTLLLDSQCNDAAKQSQEYFGDIVNDCLPGRRVERRQGNSDGCARAHACIVPLRPGGRALTATPDTHGQA